jgi:hypothetical protein
VCGDAGSIVAIRQIGAGHLPMDVLLAAGLVGCALAAILTASPDRLGCAGI